MQIFTVLEMGKKLHMHVYIFLDQDLLLIV